MSRHTRSDPKTPLEAARFPLGAPALLSGVFFLSGAAALIFETLWFRLAGLAFGNGVWASALVLAAFMAGLALGNALAVRWGSRLLRPVRLYALLELGVAAAGCALVWGFPLLSTLLAPVLRPLLEQPLLLNTLRLSIAFLLLVVPATAMGLSLPLLVKALSREQASFGRTLGRLYGWNTLGAVAGALLGEVVLIEAFGVAGSGLFAGGLDVVAALGALAAGRHLEPAPIAAPPASPVGRAPRRLLAAGFLAGAILLALEVVWFRFLQLFFPGTSLTFAIMLAIVLAGIGLGGLLASLWFRLASSPHRYAHIVALAAGAGTAFLYSTFHLLAEGRSEAARAGLGLESVPLSLYLIFPVTILSGVLFSFVGHAVYERLGDEARSAGLVTMWNTIGAALGPLAAGFLLIPRLGMEISFFILAVGYGGVALLLATGETFGRRSPRSATGWAGLAIFLLAVGLFPFGRMRTFIEMASAKYRADGSRIVAIREGLTETIQYLETPFLGKPLSHRLVTNSFSMAGTHAAAMRYMKYYVYWPVALHPAPRNALLISYGSGSTAKALVDTPGLETIDIVDLSREILEMSPVVYPDPAEDPLADPRVTVHVEDGRFFLQVAGRAWDIITSEPPPPKLAGVESLYTEEYFRLVRDSLRDGGVATYWLPVYEFTEEETKSVLKAFRNAFEEATLWTGRGLDWMLVGTKNARGPVSEEEFSRQWRDARVAREMRSLGFELPEQIGATFILGAEDLAALTRESLPLTDNFPKRLSARLGAGSAVLERYRRTMDVAQTRRRFETSPYIRRLWPDALRVRTSEYFGAQQVLNDISLPHVDPGVPFGALHPILEGSSLRIPILWALKSPVTMHQLVDEELAAGRAADATTAYHLGARALADRSYDAAAQHFAASYRAKAEPVVLLLRIYALCLAGRSGDASTVVDEHLDFFRADPARRSALAWLGQVAGFVHPILEAR